MRRSLGGSDWLLRGFLDEGWRAPAALGPDAADPDGWCPATVPGSVHHDLWRHGLAPDPYRGRNALALEWIPQRSWVYRKRLQVEERLRGRRARLVFEGLDHAARIFLNGERLGRHASQFVPARFEVADRLAYGAGNLVTVVLEPAPPGESQGGRTSRVRHHRTRMNQGWDFCPRMPHLGIWDEAYLEFTGATRLEDVWVRPRLASDRDRADVIVQAEVSTPVRAPGRVEVEIRRGGAVVAGERLERVFGPGTTPVRFSVPLERPELWWPNGHGKPALYEAEVRLVDEGGGAADARTVPFGVRRLAWARNDTPDASARPYTVVVNGRRIYLKGWNWVPLDALYGVERPERLERLLSLAQRAHVNLLRVWGGGLIEKRAFFELCDRLGIMVWQEFIQSSSAVDRTPAEDAAYLEMMRREAEGIVPRRRNHPSLVIWCGGNELEGPDLLPLGEDAPVLALLRTVVERLDPDRLWLPTSASGPMPFCGINTATNAPWTMHDVHGPWHHQGLTGQYTLLNRSRALLHSELGAEALADLPTLRATIPQGERWPATPERPTWAHLGATHWLQPARWREAFGDVPDLATLVRATQMLQAEGVRYALEANRRRRFENSGSLPWMFHEPYPMAAGTAAVGYDARPRPLYHAVARAYAPVSVSASFARQAWAGEEAFTAEVWVDNGLPQDLEGTLSIRLVDPSGRAHAERNQDVAVRADRPASLGPFRAPLAEMPGIFFLDLRLAGGDGASLAHNRYPFTRGADLSALLGLPPTTIAAAWDGDRLTLANEGAQAALFVWAQEDRPFGEPARVHLEDNHLCLLPDERTSVGARPLGEPGGRALEVAGWNTNVVVAPLLEEAGPAGGEA